MENKKIDLIEFIPEKVKCGKNQKEYTSNLNSDSYYLMVSYCVDTSNQFRHQAKKEYSLTVPKYVKWDKETFEVLGLLQAEMGKTNNGCITFCNHEYPLINKVMRWFEKELELMCNQWRWYIKLNIREPEDISYKKVVEDKVIHYWLNKTKINVEKKYPKTVTYIKDTKNEKLKYYDYGTLIIEHKSNLLSQIIKRYVRFMSCKVLNLGKEEIGGFIRGIIAGEGTVEIHKESRHYRVHITADNKNERNLYQNCLVKLGIRIVQYEDYKEMIISKRKNNIELLKQKLMCLSPEKYSKFLNMMKLYPRISEETGYFTKNKKPHNKLPQERINKILELHHQNPNWPCWKIAEMVGVSTIKVARVRKEHNLGKRLNKTSKEMIEKVIELHNKNPSAYAYEIANQLGLHKTRVERIRRKYGLKRSLNKKQI